MSQPDPTPNASTPVWTLVIADMQARDHLGRERYGTPLQAHNGRTAREGDDERHVCPLQLGLIDRAIRLWSNPSEVVLSPFMGIGSEGWAALRAHRKFVGIELKESYWRQACNNLRQAESETASDLFLEGTS